ncbi:hypothetical protein KBC75_04980 [Candidatus Shapirobacteria bacterium]|nr:hypothetical protein [Candidatus Shapirobacteria bacterium]
MIVFIPLIYIIIISLLLTPLYTTKFKLSPASGIFFSLVNTPVLLSLVNYGLFFFFPGRPIFFYLSIFTILLIISFIFGRHYQFQLPTIKINHDFFTKTILLLSSTLLILISLRMWFWPINWDDQIYYIEQSYSIGQDRSIDRFINWGFFQNNQLHFQTNPAIRPGLPLLQSIASYFSTNIQDAVLFSRLITTYFFWLLLCILVYLQPKTWPLTIFFTLTCYIFVNLSIFGFKELVLISQTLICLKVLSETKKLPIRQMVLIGICFGLMSYINYSGAIISFIVYVILLVFQKNNSFFKLLAGPVFLVLITIFSGLEIIYFLGVALDGSFQKIDIKQQTATVLNRLNITSKTSINSNSGAEPSSSYGRSELASYDINNATEMYTKGKLQGLFQIQYFGLIFDLLLITIIFNILPTINDNFNKYILGFVLLFFAIFLDIFHLVHHPYAEVLSISHKYTAFLVPFASLIISSLWPWWTKQFQKIPPKFFLIISLVSSIFLVFYFSFTANLLLSICNLFIPTHNSPSYYLSVITLALQVFRIINIITLLVGIIFYLIHKNTVISWWQEHQLSTLIIIITFFYFPFLLFFHTNFGIDYTLINSFSSPPQKLSKIKGWESIYTTVNFLNELPQDSHLLFVNTNLSQLGIHLTNSANNNFTINNTPTHTVNQSDISSSAQSHNIDYLIVNPQSFSFPQYKLLHKTSSLSVYQLKSTN